MSWQAHRGEHANMLPHDVGQVNNNLTDQQKSTGKSESKNQILLLPVHILPVIP